MCPTPNTSTHYTYSEDFLQEKKDKETITNKNKNNTITCFYQKQKFDKKIQVQDIDDICVFWGSQLNTMLNIGKYKISTQTETAKLSGFEDKRLDLKKLKHYFIDNWEHLQNEPLTKNKNTYPLITFECVKQGDKRFMRMEDGSRRVQNILDEESYLGTDINRRIERRNEQQQNSRRKPRSQQHSRNVFANQCSIKLKINHENPNNNHYVSVKVFQNGSLQFTGMQENIKKDIKKIVLKLLRTAEIIDEETDFTYKCVLINASYKIDRKLNNENIHKLFLEKYSLHSFYDSNMQAGVRMYYYYDTTKTPSKQTGQTPERGVRINKKNKEYQHIQKITVIIFKSGQVIITGSKNIKYTDHVYKTINKIFQENVETVSSSTQ